MRFAGLIFVVVGLVMVGVCLYLYNDSRVFMETAVSTQGEVVAFDRRFDSSARNRDRADSYYPVIAFVARNSTKVRFTANVGSNPPAYAVGEQVEVLYDAINPHNARLGGFFALWFGTIMMGFMGVLFSAIGLFTVVKGIRRAIDRDWLLANGQLIQADFLRVEYDDASDSGGNGGWYILAQWQNPRTRKVHVMRSENLGYDPTSFMPGTTVPVRINPLNPEKYWVDTTFLPEKA